MANKEWKYNTKVAKEQGQQRLKSNQNTAKKVKTENTYNPNTVYAKATGETSTPKTVNINTGYKRYMDTINEGGSQREALSSLKSSTKRINTGNEQFDNILYSGVFDKSAKGRLERARMQSDYFARQLKPLEEIGKQIEANPSYGAEIQRRYSADSAFRTEYDGLLETYRRYIEAIPQIEADYSSAYEEYKQNYFADKRRAEIGDNAYNIEKYTKEAYGITDFTGAVERGKLRAEKSGDLILKSNLPEYVNGEYVARPVTDRMNENEKNIYYALYESNPYKAQKFKKEIEEKYTNQIYDKEIEKLKTKPVTRAISLAAADILKYPEAAINTLTGGRLYNGGYKGFGEFSNRVWDQTREGFESEAGKTATDVTRAIGDIMAAYISGGGTKYMMAAMGTRSASDAMTSARERGGSEAQILASGIISAGIEYLTERIGTGKILGMIGKPTKSIIKQMIVSGGEEFSEEFISQMAQMLSDAALMGDKSHFNNLKNQYMKDGLSEKEAIKKVLNDILLEQPLDAGIIGFFSGAILGGGSAAYSNFGAGAEVMNDSESIKSFDDLTKEILNTDASDYKGNVIKLQEQLQRYKTDFENSRTKFGKIMSAGKAVAVASEFKAAPKVIFLEGNVKPETREFLNEAAKKSNVTILVGDINGAEGQLSTETGGAIKSGAFYVDKNTIAIDWRSEPAKITEAVTLHEMTHSAESSKYYDAFKDYVKSRMGAEFDKQVIEIGKYYKDNGKMLKRSEAEAEVVANYTRYNLLANKEAMNRFVKSNYGTAQLFADGAKDIINKVKSVFGVETDIAVDDGIRYLERAIATRGTNSLTSTAGVQYNIDEGKSDQYGTMWTLEANVLDNNEVASFYNLIGEKEHGKGILQNSNGEFIFDVSDKLVYSNGDYLNPQITKVVSFNTTDADTIELAKEIILNEEYYGTSSEVLYNEIVEAVLGEGIITTTNFEDFATDRRKENHFGKGSGGGKIDIGSREDVSYSIENPISEDDYKNMKNHFGVTGNFNVAGYMLKDGIILDFSGKHWGDTTSKYRQVDHRDIQEVLVSENNGIDAMVNMISNGNIRLMPEVGGINLAVAPTKNQRTVLRRYIEFMSPKEGIIVDIDKVGGDTIKTFTYDEGTSANDVLRDIDNYFRGGTQSDVMSFHTSGEGGHLYSIENLTPEQVEAARSSEKGQERGGLEYENSNTEGLGADGTYRIGWDKNLRQAKSRSKAERILRSISELALQDTDAEGRILTANIKEYFEKTVAKNSEGYLVPLFHGTLSDFDISERGAFGFHFGTIEQAQKRIKDLLNQGKKGNERIIEGYVNIVNPFHIKGDRETLNPLVVGHEARVRGIISIAEFDRIGNLDGFIRGDYDSEASKALREILEKKGYDGIIYNNGFEDAGLSFIVFKPNQIKYVTNEEPTSNPNMKYSTENHSPEQVEAIKKVEESGDKVSEFYKNSLQKEVVTPAVKAEDAPERHKYKPISNEETYKRGRAYVNDVGFEKAKDELEMKFDEGIPLTSEEVGRAEYIFTRLQSEGKTSESVLFAERWNRSVTEGARALQALQILDRLTPEGKYLYAVRQAERKTEKQVSRLKGEKKKNFEKELAEAKRKDKIAEDADKKLLEEAEKGEMLVELMEPKKNGKKPREVEKVYKKYGIDYLSKADREYISDTLKTLDGLETKEDFINLILKQNRDRGRTNPWWLKKQLEKTDIAFLKDTAWHQVIRKTQDIEESTVASKIKTARIMAMLMNGRTFLRNMVSNFAFSGLDATATNVSVIADWIASKATGQRTVTADNYGFTKGGGKAMGDAYRKSTIEIALDTQAGEDKYGLGRKAVFKKGPMAALERGMGYMLTSTDAMSEGGIINSTTKGLQKLRDSGKLKISDEQIEQFAKEVSDFRTFKDKNAVSSALNDIKNAFNKAAFKDKSGAVAFGAGDFVLPFVQVPGAIVQRSIEFSPLGYCKVIKILSEVKKNGGLDMETQRNMALSIGRATTGTGLTLAFALLAMAGIVTGSKDDEDKEKRAQYLEKEQGLTGFQLNLSALGRLITTFDKEEAKPKNGDTLVKYDFLEPISSNMAVGYAIAQGGGWLDIASLSTAKFFEQLTDTTGFDTIEKLFDKEKTLSEKVMPLAVDAGTSFIPRVLPQTAQFIDPVARNAYDEDGAAKVGLARFKSSIPWVSKTVPAKVNPLGSEVSYSTGNRVMDFMNAFINPGTVSKYHTNAVIDEVQKVYKETGEGSILPSNITKNKDISLGDGIKTDIYGHNFEKYKKEVGTMLYSAYDEAMKTEAYKKMSYSEKAEALKKLKNAAEDKAKAKFAIEEGKVKGVESIKMEIDTEKNYLGSILPFHPENSEKYFKWGDYESASGFISYLEKNDKLTAEAAEKINKHVKEKEYISSEAKDAVLKSAAAAGSEAPFKRNYDSIFEWSEDGIKYKLEIKPEEIDSVMRTIDFYTDQYIESLYKDGYYKKKGGIGKVKNSDGVDVAATWENMSNEQRCDKVATYKTRVVDGVRGMLAIQRKYKYERVTE